MAETNSNCVSRQDLKAAIARAVELRAIHAALMQGGSPTHSAHFSSSSPPPPPPPQLSAHDYPIFTPSYEDEPLSGCHQLQLESRALSEAWEDHITENGSSRKNSALGLANLDSHSQVYPTDHDTRSVTSSCTNQITVLQTSPKNELLLKSIGRNSLGDLKSVSSCNNCSNNKNGNGVNDTDSIASSSTTNCKQPRSKGMVLSWLLPRSKKKPKGESSSPRRTESKEETRIKQALFEANHKRDAALAEVAGMRSSFGELRKKLENLEGYCEELKRALKQEQAHEKLIGNLSKRGNLVPEDNLMPVSAEVMVEGFLQIVSEARLSVKNVCKALVRQIEETDLNSLLQPYKLSLDSKSSKVVLYHLEAIINQELYQDFENCVFQRNGTPKLLDPQQDRQARFSSFVALRNLSWKEVTGKGTKYYSEELSRFCDQKMSCIISALSWTRPWPEQLLQTFFVAAKCVWLVHLLAFSFYPPLTILRVEENREFDPHYMEDIPMDRQRTRQRLSQVKIMVMPGFYVHDKILKCKVLCRYKSVT